MDLWIRSQDREQLIKTNVVIYSYFEDKFTKGLHIITNDNYDLGIYKTKERALEVLDEIQEILQTRQHYSHCNVVNLIFEMPKE